MSVRDLVAGEHVTFREFLNSPPSRILEFQVAGETLEGLEAFELVTRLKPDLALMNIEMPRVGGLEVVRRIKAHNDGTSVILRSAVADAAHRQAVDGTRADAVLTKNARMCHALGRSQRMKCRSQVTSCLTSLARLGTTKKGGKD